MGMYANRGTGFESLFGSIMQHVQKVKVERLLTNVRHQLKYWAPIAAAWSKDIWKNHQRSIMTEYIKAEQLPSEAKSTKDLKRFPLGNVEQHQYEYLIDCHNQGAISFMLIEFRAHRIVYLIPALTLRSFWTGATSSAKGRGSITIGELDFNAYTVDTGACASGLPSGSRKKFGG